MMTLRILIGCQIGAVPRRLGWDQPTDTHEMCLLPDLPPNSDSGSPFLADFQELTLLDLVMPPWCLAGDIKLAPLTDKTSHLSLKPDSLLSLVTSFSGEMFEGVGQGDAD